MCAGGGPMNGRVAAASATFDRCSDAFDVVETHESHAVGGVNSPPAEAPFNPPRLHLRLRWLTWISAHPFDNLGLGGEKWSCVRHRYACEHGQDAINMGAICQT